MQWSYKSVFLDFELISAFGTQITPSVSLLGSNATALATMRAKARETVIVSERRYFMDLVGTSSVYGRPIGSPIRRVKQKNSSKSLRS